jgi:hypothetical protein
MRDLFIEFKTLVKEGGFCLHPHTWVFSQNTRVGRIDFREHDLTVGNYTYPKKPKHPRIAHGYFMNNAKKTRGNEPGFYLCSEDLCSKYKKDMQALVVNETAIIATFCAVNKGFYSEVSLNGLGRVDLKSDKHIVEVKRIDNWKHALGQILVYKTDFIEHQCSLILFGRNICQKRKDRISSVCSKYEVRATFWSLENKNCQNLKGWLE